MRSPYSGARFFWRRYSDTGLAVTPCVRVKDPYIKKVGIYCTITNHKRFLLSRFISYVYYITYIITVALTFSNNIKLLLKYTLISMLIISSVLHRVFTEWILCYLQLHSNIQRTSL